MLVERTRLYNIDGSSKIARVDRTGSAGAAALVVDNGEGCLAAPPGVVGGELRGGIRVYLMKSWRRIAMFGRGLVLDFQGGNAWSFGATSKYSAQTESLAIVGREKW